MARGEYPGGPFNDFVSGATEGFSWYLKARKDADDLTMQLAENKAKREAAGALPRDGTGDYGGGGTEKQPAFDTPGGKGTGGGGGGGGGGEWGEYAAPIVDFFKKAGYTGAAIQGIMANGLAEGGFAQNWKKAGGDENSWGHWQFNRGGELPGYEKWARENNFTDLQDSVTQARYVDYRMNQIDPNFKKLTDPRAATNQFLTGFEKPKVQTADIRVPHLERVQKYLGELETAQADFAQRVGGGTPATGQPSGAALQPSYGSGMSSTDIYRQLGGTGTPAPVAAPAPAPAPAQSAAFSASTPGARATLPALSPNYVFGKSVPRPQTDAQGNITQYAVDPKQAAADRTIAGWGQGRQSAIGGMPGGGSGGARPPSPPGQIPASAVAQMAQYLPPEKLAQIAQVMGIGGGLYNETGNA